MTNRLAITEMWDQTVLVHSDIHKSTKVRDVGDRSFQNHARLQVFDVIHAFLEFGGFELRSRIPSWLVQFFENVLKSRQTELFGDVFLRFDASEEQAVPIMLLMSRCSLAAIASTTE